MKEESIKHILNIIYQVGAELGSGFLEKVYENSLLLALTQEGFTTETQTPLKVIFRDHVVGDFFADILVEKELLIELKACSTLKPEHSAQVINYLKAGKLKVGFLVNYGSNPPTVKRLYQK